MNFQGILTIFFMQFLALLPIAAEGQNPLLTFLIRICTNFVFFVQFSRSEICSLACCFQIPECMWHIFSRVPAALLVFTHGVAGGVFAPSLIVCPKLDMTASNIPFALSILDRFLGVHVFVFVCISRVLYLGSGL